MAYSYNEVGAVSPGQGIAVPFKFLDRVHVRVLVDGVVTDKYSWLNNGMLQASTGFPSGTVTRVERNTPVSLLKAVLEGTAVFDFDGVNENFSLLLFILQEYVDKESSRNAQIDEVMEGFAQIATAVQAAQEAAETAASDAAAGALAAIEDLLEQITLARNAALLAQQKAEEAQGIAEESAENAKTFDPANFYTKVESDTLLGTKADSETTLEALLNRVRVDEAQSISSAQRGQARANIGAGILSGHRNKIINGDFGIWQRGTSFSGVTGAVQFGPDRWTAFQAGATVAWSQVAFSNGQNVIPGEPEFFGRVTAGAGSSLSVGQRIESARTLAGKRVTVTGYVKGNAERTCDVSLRQLFGSGGSTTVVTTLGSVNILNGVWSKFSFTGVLPSIAGKTLGANHCLGLFFENFSSASFQFDVARVSVVEGDATTEEDPFAARHQQQELDLCYRYYWRAGRKIELRLYVAGSDVAYVPFYHPPMRSTPTQSLTNVVYGGTGFQLQVGTSAEGTGFAQVGTTGAGMSTVGFDIALDAEL